MKTRNKKIKCCPECHSTKFKKDEIHAELYCRCCGLVISAPYQEGVIYPDFLFFDENRNMFINMMDQQQQITDDKKFKTKTYKTRNGYVTIKF